MRTPTAEEAETISMGVQAEELVKHPVFASVINELSERVANTLLATAPEETSSRERLYYMHTALREIVAVLQARIIAKASIEASLSEPTEND